MATPPPPVVAPLPDAAERARLAREAAARVRALGAARALPLHVAVWDGDAAALRAALGGCEAGAAGLDRLDPRGHTALLLALRLERLHLVPLLLEARACALARDADGFSAFQLCAHVPGRAGLDAHAATLRAALRERWERSAARAGALLDELEAIPDVDLELHWTFSTWLPLASRLLPADSVRVRKRGSSVRVDSSLRSFGARSLAWQRGAVSAVLRGRGCADAGELHLVDHEERATASLRERLCEPSARALALACLQLRNAAALAASHPPRLPDGAAATALLDGAGAQRTAVVAECWANCALYELRGARVAVRTRRNAARGASVAPAGAPAPAPAAGDDDAAAAEGADEVAELAARLHGQHSRLRPVRDALRALLPAPAAARGSALSPFDRPLLGAAPTAAAHGAAEGGGGAEGGARAVAPPARLPVPCARRGYALHWHVLSEDGRDVRVGVEWSGGACLHEGELFWDCAQHADEDAHAHPRAQLAPPAPAACAHGRGARGRCALPGAGVAWLVLEPAGGAPAGGVAGWGEWALGAAHAQPADGAAAAHVRCALRVRAPPGADAEARAAAALAAMGGEAEAELVPFADYFGEPDAPPPDAGPPRADGAFRRLPTRCVERELGAATLAMAPAHAFPLTLAQMLPLARALAASSSQHAALEAFLGRALPEGFPVSFSLPVFPTVSATVTFGRARTWARTPGGDAAPGAPEPSVFEVPPEYARGKYRAFGERMLDEA